MLETLIEKAPYIAALVGIVLLFLRHLEKRDKVIQGIAADNREVHNDCIESIRENSKALGANKEALHAVTLVLRKANGGTG